MAFVATCAMLPACLLFTSLDDTSGGAEPPAAEAGPNDGTAPATETGAVDAPSGDASTDGGIPTPEAGFCAQDAGPGVVLCSEFSGTDPSAGFSGLGGAVGTLELDEGNLLARVPVLGQYEQGKHVYQIVNGAFSILSCSFAFRRDVIGDELISVAELAVQTNAEHYSVFLYTAPTSGRLLVADYPADGGDGIFNSTAAGLGAQPGEWHRVGLEATATHVRVYIDGQLDVSLPHQSVPAAFQTTFKLGIPQIDGDNLQPWELRFDDVRCIRMP
jgi:hypothetical protein